MNLAAADPFPVHIQTCGLTRTCMTNSIEILPQSDEIEPGARKFTKNKHVFNRFWAYR